MLRLSKKLDYSLSLLTHLAKVEHTENAKNLANRFNFPQSIISNILKELKNNKLLKSTRGPNGGYYLSRPPELVTIYQIVEIVDGPIFLADCIEDNDSCGAYAFCGSRSSVLYLQGQILKLFQSICLDDMVRSNNKVDYFFTNTIKLNNIYKNKNE